MPTGRKGASQARPQSMPGGSDDDTASGITLDAEGNATIKPNFELDENAPGMLNANLVVKVFLFGTEAEAFEVEICNAYEL